MTISVTVSGSMMGISEFIFDDAVMNALKSSYDPPELAGVLIECEDNEYHVSITCSDNFENHVENLQYAIRLVIDQYT